jgi:RNase P subunit RPR2
LERYMHCRQCSEVRRYPYERSHLVALRVGKITASNPPSHWWPGER